MDICKFRHPPSALENDTGDGDDVLEQFKMLKGIDVLAE